MTWQICCYFPKWYQSLHRSFETRHKRTRLRTCLNLFAAPLIRFCILAVRISTEYKLLHIRSRQHTESDSEFVVQSVFYCFSLENNTKSCNKSYVLLWVNWKSATWYSKVLFMVFVVIPRGNPGRRVVSGSELSRLSETDRPTGEEERSGTVLLKDSRSTDREIPLRGNNPAVWIFFPWVIWVVGGKIQKIRQCWIHEFFNLQVTLTWKIIK